MSLSNSAIKFIETNIFANENLRNEKEKQIASFLLIKFFQILPLLFNKNKTKNLRDRLRKLKKLVDLEQNYE